MGRLRQEGLWRPARDVPFFVLSVAVVLSLIRSVSQPGFVLGIGSSDVRVVPADLALALLGILCAARLLGRGTLPRPARAVVYTALAFSAWLLVSAAANGLDPLVGAVKLLEFGLLGLGAVLFVQSRRQLWLLVTTLVGVATVAAVWGLLQFFDLPPIYGAPYRREPSFTGEHDLAALGTMALVLGLASLYAPRHRLRLLPHVALVAGGVGIVLGAALAGLVGLYLAVAAVVGIALARRQATRRALAATAIVVALVTVGVIALRSGDLGNLLKWLGLDAKEDAAESYAQSWSQRLIYVYVGGRMFLANPVLGTGWHGTIPASEYARFLDDAHRRFPNEPQHYFPPADGAFVPQQTYDQILYSLGAVGALLFVALALACGRAAVAVARRWPRGEPDEVAAYLPLPLVGALAGGLAGAALFGGIPFAAIFWLTIGLAALAPSLVPVQALAREPVAVREELSPAAP